MSYKHKEAAFVIIRKPLLYVYKSHFSLGLSKLEVDYITKMHFVGPK